MAEAVGSRCRSCGPSVWASLWHSGLRAGGGARIAVSDLAREGMRHHPHQVLLVTLSHKLTSFHGEGPTRRGRGKTGEHEMLEPSLDDATCPG